ncbi:MAG: 30S ribosomal protein S8 [Planctomycetota bacterium]|nr:30S ribosomal protein S8 [Planctomycetota bacterium]
MSMTDPISDMLTRIRNATRVHKKTVAMPASKVKQGIAQVLKEEGFISDFQVEPGTPSAQLILNLKYGETGEFVIRSIQRVSKPGCRVYCPAEDLRPIVRGLGIQILSTPKGIVSDRTARRDRIGGEVLCKVY